jgi:hypothetical protein
MGKLRDEDEVARSAILLVSEGIIPAINLSALPFGFALATGGWALLLAFRQLTLFPF